MNQALKYGLFFLGGVAVGALGATVVSRGRFDFKPLAADLISRGMDMKDAVLAGVETARENVEDLLAEAHHASEQRKAKTHPADETASA